MWELILRLFDDMLSTIIEQVLTAFEDFIGDMFRSSLMIETLPGLDQTVLSSAVVSSLSSVLYGFMVLLLGLKFLWKGFKVYILWRDGESEVPPGEMAIGAFFAMVVAIAFPYLYEIGVDVVMEISSALIQALGYSYSTNWIMAVTSVFTGNTQGGFIIVLLSLVYLILLILLIFKLLGQGVELLVWRLGIPLAVVGLVDSDGGAWKPYIQMLFKQFGTVLVQYVLISIGVRLIAGLSLTGLLLGIMCEMVAFSAPKLLSQFLAPSGGGSGISQKAYTIAMVMKALGG